MLTRRKALISGAAALAGTAALLKKGDADAAKPGPGPGGGGLFTPVTVPNGGTLPFTMVDGAKQFHLIAEPVKREFAPGMIVNCWGYNGMTPGPVIEAVEGDRVRLIVTNRLPERTSVHWHG